MSGNKAAAEKRRATLIKKYGSIEAWQEKQKQWGLKGGIISANTPGGLNALTKEQRSEIGKAGHKAMMEKAMKEARGGLRRSKANTKK